MPEHIVRNSFGKDSLKMLDVIITRGLPLDRVTTTDVWATDTIPAELPPVLDAKARIEEKLWQMYRIDVEHLCARNKDGSKKTYEQMFYHVPVRRSQSVQVERESRPEAGRPRNTESKEQSPDFLPIPDTTTARSSSLFRPQGFPAQISPWCRKLKIDKVKTPPLHGAPHEARKKKYRGVYRHRSGRAGSLRSAK